MEVSKESLLKALAEIRRQGIFYVEERSATEHLRNEYLFQVGRVYGIDVVHKIKEDFTICGTFNWLYGLINLTALREFYNENPDRGYIVDDKGTMLSDVIQLYKDVK